MFDAGDGAPVFVVRIVGVIVVASALFVEFRYHPPFWVHVALWLPTIAILTLVLLRFGKSLLLVLQYKHRAGEGRVER